MTARRRGSLVRRLSIGASLWVAALVLVVGSAAVFQYWRTSVRAIDARLTEEARALAGRITVVNGLLEIDIDTPAAVPPAAGPAGAPLTDAVRYYGIYDATGRLLDGRAPAPPRLTPGPATGTRDGFRVARVAGPRDSVVVVGESLAPAYADVRRLLVSLLIASAAGAALALPVGVWLRRQLARSIRQIGETARGLAPGHPMRIDPARVDEELVAVARALNDAFDRLEQALARERQLTSDASHELRTPVTALVTETQWALGRERTAEEYRRSLEVCARQGQRMKALVESLLTLARLEAGALPSRREPVALRALADETAAELRPLAERHDVRVALDGEADALADPVQIRILLSNLLSNAIRYNRPGGEVVVRLDQENGRARVAVSDTGPGLDPDAVPHVFERFWRADPSRAARDGGSGLGLAISKAIVDAHGGAIACDSRPGDGATFTVTLPTS